MNKKQALIFGFGCLLIGIGIGMAIGKYIVTHQ